MSEIGGNWWISCPSIAPGSGVSPARPRSPSSRPRGMADLLRQDTRIFVLRSTPELAEDEQADTAVSSDSGDDESEASTPPATPESVCRKTSMSVEFICHPIDESPPASPSASPEPVSNPAAVDRWVTFAYGTLHMRRMPGDGNCLFHSISAIEGSVFCQDWYRREVADEIWNQDDMWFACYLAPVWDGDREDYCRYISQDGHWGGEQEIALLAARLNIELWVFDTRAAEPRAILYNTGSKRKVGVLVFSGNHYDTVEYRLEMHSAGSSLFPAGCGDRLMEAVVELIHPNKTSWMSLGP